MQPWFWGRERGRGLGASVLTASAQRVGSDCVTAEQAVTQHARLAAGSPPMHTYVVEGRAAQGAPCHALPGTDVARPGRQVHLGGKSLRGSVARANRFRGIGRVKSSVRGGHQGPELQTAARVEAPGGKAVHVGWACANKSSDAGLWFARKRGGCDAQRAAESTPGPQLFKPGAKRRDRGSMKGEVAAVGWPLWEGCVWPGGTDACWDQLQVGCTPKGLSARADGVHVLSTRRVWLRRAKTGRHRGRAAAEGRLFVGQTEGRWGEAWQPLLLGSMRSSGVSQFETTQEAPACSTSWAFGGGLETAVGVIGAVHQSLQGQSASGCHNSWPTETSWLGPVGWSHAPGPIFTIGQRTEVEGSVLGWRARHAFRT